MSAFDVCIETVFNLGGLGVDGGTCLWCLLGAWIACSHFFALEYCIQLITSWRYGSGLRVVNGACHLLDGRGFLPLIKLRIRFIMARDSLYTREYPR
jgi:hypothetical protein